MEKAALLFRCAAVVVLVGHVCVWSTPCPSGEAYAGAAAEAVHAGQTPGAHETAHAGHTTGTHETAHAGHTTGTHETAHAGHTTGTHAAVAGNADRTLVAPCRCGCEELPQAAGVALAPGFALLPRAPAPPAHAAMTLPLVERAPLADARQPLPPDHVPIASIA